ncbi:endonuclease/exonuclease/phosphatase family protein [Spirillospora sp. CA-255316]
MAAREATADRVRVITMNVMAPEFADWPRRRAVLADGLRSLRPDIVALQEIVADEHHDGVREHVQAGPARAGLDVRRLRDQARSYRSRFITLSHAATKSRTNFSFASSLA